MNLTAESFNQILSTLRSDTTTSSNEQRKSPRVGVRSRATIWVGTGGGRTLPVTIRDLSRGGVGLLLQEAALQRGEHFLLILSDPANHFAMACKVARTSLAGPNMQLVGASYERQLSAAECDAVLKRSNKPAGQKPSAGRSTVSLVQPALSQPLSADDAEAVTALEMRLRHLQL